MIYTPAKLPGVSSEDGQALAAYLEDELQRIASNAIDDVQSVETRPAHIAPLRPRTGMLAYADGTDWNPGAGEGLYERTSAGLWRRLYDGPTPPRPEVNPNYVPCNAGFALWQLGTSIAVAASTTAWFADRWSIITGAAEACTVSRQTGMGASQFCARVQRNSGQTGTASAWIECPLDAEEVIALRGKKLSLSMLLRAGANFSAANCQAQLVIGTGATPGRLATTAYTGQTAAVIGNTGVLPATATRFQFDAAAIIPTNTTQATVLLIFVPAGTAGAADYFEIGEVTLADITGGTYTVPFNPVPFQDDFARAMRMYETNMPTPSTAPAQNVSRGEYFVGAYNTSNAATQNIRFMTRKRAVPTLTFYAPDNAFTGVVGTAGRWQWAPGGAWQDTTAVTAALDAQQDQFLAIISSAAAFAVAGAYFAAGGWVADARLP